MRVRFAEKDMKVFQFRAAAGKTLNQISPSEKSSAKKIPNPACNLMKQQKYFIELPFPVQNITGNLKSNFLRSKRVLLDSLQLVLLQFSKAYTILEIKEVQFCIVPSFRTNIL